MSSRRRFLGYFAWISASMTMGPSRLLAQSPVRNLECRLENEVVFSQPVTSSFDAVAANSGDDVGVEVRLSIPVGQPRGPRSSGSINPTAAETRFSLMVTMRSGSSGRAMTPTAYTLEISPFILLGNMPRIDIWGFVVGDTAMSLSSHAESGTDEITRAWQQFIAGEPGTIWLNDPQSLLPDSLIDGRDDEGYAYVMVQNRVDIGSVINDISPRLLDLVRRYDAQLASDGPWEPGANLGGNCRVPSGSPCFLTTASVEAMGRPDDCFELAALRRFRDEVLAPSEPGQRMINDYYAQAPGIVRRINALPEAQRIWRRCHLWFILPCAVMAWAGWVRPTVAHYTRMLHHLQARGLQAHGLQARGAAPGIDAQDWNKSGDATCRSAWRRLPLLRRSCAIMALAVASGFAAPTAQAGQDMVLREVCVPTGGLLHLREMPDFDAPSLAMMENRTVLAHIAGNLRDPEGWVRVWLSYPATAQRPPIDIEGYVRPRMLAERCATAHDPQFTGTSGSVIEGVSVPLGRDVTPGDVAASDRDDDARVRDNDMNVAEMDDVAELSPRGQALLQAFADWSNRDIRNARRPRLAGLPHADLYAGAVTDCLLIGPPLYEILAGDLDRYGFARIDRDGVTELSHDDVSILLAQEEAYCRVTSGRANIVFAETMTVEIMNDLAADPEVFTNDRAWELVDRDDDDACLRAERPQVRLIVSSGEEEARCPTYRNGPLTYPSRHGVPVFNSSVWVQWQ